MTRLLTLRTTLLAAAVIAPPLAAGPVNLLPDLSPASVAQAGRHNGPERLVAPETRLAPYDIVQTGMEQLTAFLSQDMPRDLEDTRRFLDHHIAPFFDFETMARWAAGPFHRRLTMDQQVRFTARLRALFLESLARNLGGLSSNTPQVHVYPQRLSPVTSGEQASVRAAVLSDPSPYPVQFDFRFHRRGGQGEWRIFDVAANGFSAVAYYRRLFSDQVRRFGPQALYLSDGRP